VNDLLIAVSGIVTALIAAVALLESRRALRVASVESWPVAVESGVFLGVRLRNFGPRYAKDVRWTTHIRGPQGKRRYEQSLRIPVLAAGDGREVLIGWDYGSGAKRTLPALAQEEGILVTSWDWRDGRILVFERRHREHLEVSLRAVLDDFTLALQRQPDETLAALAAIGTAIDRLPYARSEPAEKATASKAPGSQEPERGAA
jgi:hypothetical protein